MNFIHRFFFRFSSYELRRLPYDFLVSAYPTLYQGHFELCKSRLLVFISVIETCDCEYIWKCFWNSNYCAQQHSLPCFLIEFLCSSSEHFSYQKHACTSAHKKDFQVPACPLCGEPVPTPRGVSPDMTVGQHIGK